LFREDSLLRTPQFYSSPRFAGVVETKATKWTVMTRRNFFSSALGGYLSAPPFAQSKPSSARPPNFVLLLADDLGYGDLSCYGNKQIETPNIDELSHEGVKLADFYAFPTCSPSRAALLTGRYPLRSGVVRVLIPREYYGIPASEITLGQELQSCGYATACIGKWHLGDRPAYVPNKHGFDYFYGLHYSNDMTLPIVDWPPLKLFRNGQIIESPVKQSTLTRRYTDEAISFIQRNTNKPFFLYLAYTMPHVPLAVSKPFRGKSSYGRYGDAVTEIDWSAGQIMKALKSRGLDSNTVVVFTSDNGAAIRTKLLAHAGSEGPFRSGKGTTWEGGVRVPCIIRWPGHLPAGVTLSGITSLMDIFPTFVDIAGGKLPSDRTIDGKSLVDYLEGKSECPNDRFFYYSGRRLFAVRVGDWKLNLIKRERTNEGHLTPPVYCHPPELYNLASDPGEHHDVANGNQAIVDRLAKAALDFQSSMVPGKLPPPYWRTLVP
jgi:arylsulfatase A-like enzyme